MDTNDIKTKHSDKKEHYTQQYENNLIFMNMTIIRNMYHFEITVKYNIIYNEYTF